MPGAGLLFAALLLAASDAAGDWLAPTAVLGACFGVTGEPCIAPWTDTLTAVRAVLTASGGAAGTLPATPAQAAAALADPARWRDLARADLGGAFRIDTGGGGLRTSAPLDGSTDARAFAPADFAGNGSVALALLTQHPLDLAAVRAGVALEPVPLPATALLILAGLAVLWLARRRQVIAAGVLLLAGACSPVPDPELLVARAQADLDAGELRPAAATLRELLTLAPDTRYGRWLYAQLNSAVGDWAAAEREYRRALELGMSPQSALVPLVFSLLMQGHAEAVLEFQGAGGLPVDVAADLIGLKALAALAQGDLAVAGDLLQQARRQGAGGMFADLAEARLLAAQGRLDEARTALDAALQRHPERGLAWHLCGELALADGDAVRAAECFAAAVQRGPWNPQWLYDHALGQLAQGHILAAEPALERLLLLAPRAAPTNQALCRYLLSRGEPQTAAGYCQLALAVRPDHPDTLYDLATAQAALGALANAAGLLRRVIDLQPGALPARERLAALLMGQGDAAGAAGVLQPALESRSAPPEARLLYAGAMLGLGRPAEALPLLGALVREAPGNAHYRELLALALLAVGDLAGAGAAQDLATDLDAGLFEGDRRLVYGLLGAGAPDLALARAQALRVRLPQRPEVLLLLGAVHAQRGEFAAAREALAAVPSAGAVRRAAVRLLVEVALADPAMDVGAAAGLLQAQLAADPTDADAMVLLAALAARAPTLVSAPAGEAPGGHWLRQAVRTAPARSDLRLMLARWLLEQGQPAVVLPLLQPDLTAHPEDVQLLLLEATALFADGATESAWQLAWRVYGMAPAEAAGAYLVARAGLALGRRDEAIAQLTATLTLAPGLTPARLDLVAALIDAGEPGRAEVAFRPLVTDGQVTPEVLLLGGLIATGQRNGQVAGTLLAAALEAGVGRAALLPLARLEVAAGHSEAAVARYQAWLLEQPDDLPVRLALAATWVARDDLAAARAQWQAVLERDPAHLVALNNLAYALTDSDPAAALVLAEQAVALAGDLPAVADTLAAALAATGDRTRAERTLARTLARHPAAHGLRLRRARLLVEAGDTGAAMNTLEPMLKLSPDTPGWADAVALLARLQMAD